MAIEGGALRARGIRAFGKGSDHRSEPDWHFQEKPIHLRRLDDRSPASRGSPATAGKLYNDLLLTDHLSPITGNQALTAEDGELAEALVLPSVEL